MAYFDLFPDILLPSFIDNRNSSSDFTRTKNLFKRAKIRDDFFENAIVFDKFSISGDDRPDNVAKILYDDPELDWVVLLANNIINIRDEWPMSGYDLQRYLDNKYSKEQLEEIAYDLYRKVIERPEFMLDALSIEGASDSLNAEIREVLGLHFPISSFDLDLADLHKRVLSLPPVKIAEAYIKDGGILHIKVDEKTPSLLMKKEIGFIKLQ